MKLFEMFQVVSDTSLLMVSFQDLSMYMQNLYAAFLQDIYDNANWPMSTRGNIMIYVA